MIPDFQNVYALATSPTALLVVLIDVNNNARISGGVGFYDTAPQSKPTVSGSKGANAALTSLMTALSSLGLVTDSTT